MDISVIKPIDKEVIPLEQVKLHLRIDNDEEDRYIESLINAAVDYCETFTKRAINQKQIKIIANSFPKGELKLPIQPIQAIKKISYTDKTGQLKELDPKSYRKVLDVEPPVLVSWDYWPKDVLVSSGSVQIEATVGYIKVPDSIKQATLLLCGHFYENREIMRQGYVNGNEVPFSVTALLYPYKVMRW
ncbi:head-tail connector protein [Proteinivorax tanatarense]|uniref:Head-tail connector protein n=1 Tax=Proteinivorax tanatarense TaxID=1260629 RepID=A0AAU7VHJ8_9FIRM